MDLDQISLDPFGQINLVTRHSREKSSAADTCSISPISNRPVPPSHELSRLIIPPARDQKSLHPQPQHELY